MLAISMLRRASCALAVGAAAICTNLVPAGAQVINGQESATPYGQTRGWSVFVIGDGRGLNSCRATTGQGYDRQLMIDYGYHGTEAGWTLYVVANRTANDEGFGIRGAGLYFDGRLASDAQSGFGVPGDDGSSSSHAGINLTAALLGRFRAAGTVGVHINGEASRTYSLSGSSAASRMVEQCAREYGMMASAAPAPAAPRAPAPTRNAQSSLGNCPI